MKRLFVRWFCRFTIERDGLGRYRVVVKPVIRGKRVYFGRYLSKKNAMDKAEEIRKDGAFLFDSLWN